MPEWLQIVLSSLGSGSVAVLGLSYVGKKYYEAQLTKSLELSKAELQRNLETSKAELARFSVEHQIRFSHLHTIRAEAIFEGYRKLKNLYDAVNIYTNPAGPIHDNAREGLRTAAGRAISDVEEFWNPRVIYLSKESANTLINFLDLLQSESIRFRFLVDTPNGVRSTNEWAEISKKVRDDGRQLLEQLADDYRKILGVT